MVLFPSSFTGVTDDVATAKSAIASVKSLVLVPTHREGRQWDDVVSADLSKDTATQVEEFKAAPAPAKLRLVARYDGVDLPGNTCRSTRKNRSGMGHDLSAG